MTFGEYIYEKRKTNGFTIRDLSGMISASPSYISGIERGTRTAPNSDILKKFSDAFALSDEEEAKMMAEVKEEFSKTKKEKKPVCQTA